MYWHVPADMVFQLFWNMLVLVHTIILIPYHFYGKMVQSSVLVFKTFIEFIIESACGEGAPWCNGKVSPP